VLIGGMGADTLVGGSGEDLLIAGGTTFDSNAVALMAILAEWNSAHSQAQRVKNLTNGTVDSQTGDIHAPTGAGLNRLNGDYFLISGAGATADQPATLLHETSIDVLVGGGGWDWLIIDSLDIDAGSKHDLVEALNS
jgi:hypothetical protein